VFWQTVMLGVSLPTLLTYLVGHATAGQPRLVGGPAVFAGQLLGYGLVWVGRFLILDRSRSPMLSVSGLTSTDTGLAPRSTNALAVLTKV
jgi:hypothetical protein